VGLLAVSSVLAISFPPALATPDFSFKAGTFTKSTGAAPVSQSITGIGFSPEALIFFWTRQTTAGLASQVQAGYGFTTGPANERAIAIASNDAVAPSNTGKRQSQQRSIILLSGGSPTLGAQAELLSLDADGFTLNWTTNEARADIIHYVALGGADLTNAFANSFTVVAGAGMQSVTGVGFQPDFVMTLSMDDASLDSNDSIGKASLGFASAPTARGTLSVTLRDGQSTTDTCVRQRVDRFLSELRSDCGDDMLADLVSFDADGFTINKTNADDATLVHYLALKGGKYGVGAFNKSPSAAPASQSVSGLGFQPVGLLLASKDLPSSTAIVAEGRISFGASDGTNEGATWFHDKDALSTTDTNQRTASDKIAVHASQTTLDAEADLASFDADGFTLTWNPNSGAADEILYVAFGSTVSITQSIAEAWNLADVSSLLATKGMPEAWTTGDAANTSAIRALLDGWLASDSVSRLATGALAEGWTMVDGIGQTIISLPSRVTKALAEDWRLRDSIGRTGMKEITESVRLAESPLLAALVSLGEAWRNSDRTLLAALKSLGEELGLAMSTLPAGVEQPAAAATMDGTVSQDLSYLPWLFGVGVGILLAALLRRRRRKR
jgi:hypothetical protein